MGQTGEQLRPVAADLGEESLLAAASEQVTGHCDREYFGLAARRLGSWSWRYLDPAAGDCLVDEDIDVDEQLLGWQHGSGLLRITILDDRIFPQEASLRQRSSTASQPT
jgi:hypothetical protein